MLTNNFYNLLYCAMAGKTITNGMRRPDGNFANMYFVSGGYGTSSDFFETFTYDAKTVASSKNARGLSFGTGSAAPTIEDYCLSGDFIANVSIVANTITGGIADRAMRYTNAITIRNSGTDTITINEIALMCEAYFSSSSVSPCLVDRQVLDTPLTLAPGEQGVITYTFNLPIVQ